MAARDLTGEKFGRLTVLRRVPDNVSSSGYKTVMWECRCDCGNEIVVRGKCLTSGVTRSCGCLAKELMSKRATKHSGFGTRLYAVWNSMRQRCNNPNNRAYKNYGGRGISVCGQWDDFAAFREWAIQSGYKEDAERGELTLDRIDTNGDYCPGNCRWTDMSTQTNNRRESILIPYNGVTKPLTEWAAITGIQYCTLWKRYKKGLGGESLFASVN